MIIDCKPATTEYGAETFFQSQLVKMKRRLLTSEENKEQGKAETSKALKDFKKYCRSSSENLDFWENKLGNLTNRLRFATCINNLFAQAEHSRLHMYLDQRYAFLPIIIFQF